MTSGLDPKERIRFRNIISSLAKDRIVILPTHIEYSSVHPAAPGLEDVYLYYFEEEGKVHEHI